MNLYLDESGDLGWIFDKPNRNGGSSRYLTISGVLISDESEKYILRFITEIYKKYNLTPNIEKKGANFISEHAKYIGSQLNRILNKDETFKIVSITVNKIKVNERLRNDNNIFYNYVLGLLVKNHIFNYDNLNIVIDARTIKVSHGQSFPDYIKTEVWGKGHDIGIECNFVDSKNNKMIWFADWFANFVWRHYENGDSSCYQILNNPPYTNVFIENRLFF